MINYGFKKALDVSFKEARKKVTRGLKSEGFGVLTEIDVKETLKKKLGVDFKKYVILGACNPPFAYESLQAEEDIGLLLPCNVVIYEEDEEKSTVSIIKPTVAMAMIDNQELKNIAVEVEGRLERVIKSL